MPTYSYQCNDCEEIKDDLRPISEREDPMDCDCGGKMEYFINAIPPVHFDDLAGVEPVQYWRDNPKSPTGFDVYPHKNKFTRGGFDK